MTCNHFKIIEKRKNVFRCNLSRSLDFISRKIICKYYCPLKKELIVE